MVSQHPAPVAPDSVTAPPAESAAAPSRRSLLRLGLAGLAGLALGAVGRPARASAAAGGPIVMGASNDAGTTNTTLSAASTGTALLVNQNSTGTALRGVAGNGIAGFFTSQNGSGVSGVVANATKYGVYGGNDAATYGGGAAMRAAGKQNHGVVATTANTAGYAVQAQNTAAAATAGTAIIGLAGGATATDNPMLDAPAAGQFFGPNGIIASAPSVAGDGYGVMGFSESDTGVGVYGEALSTTGYVNGLYGLAYSPDGVAVEGLSSADSGVSMGVRGTCYSSDVASAGVVGEAVAGGGNGVVGLADEAGGFGVIGVTALSDNDERGVYGYAEATTGVAYGVYGKTDSADGFGVYSDGNAHVEGDLDVSGNLTKAGGTFKIDHPIDPANKYLYHSFVESPDMLNVYAGTVKLDAAGAATVQLPAWFEALNRDFRYQLTALDKAAPDLHVSARVKDARFAIAGGQPGQEVSWQLTGVRHDAWAEAHRTPVEQAKPAAERGRYLHPAEHGKPKSMGMTEAHKSVDRVARLRKVAHAKSRRPRS